jgi:hypothetical protein
MKKLMLLLLLLISSCGSDNDVDSQVRGTAPVIIGVNAFSVSDIYLDDKWERAYSQMIYNTLEYQQSPLLHDLSASGDLSSLECSNYNQLSREQRKMFWALFFASLARYESGFNPQTRYYEPTLGHYSEGLLQLSISDSRYHQFCNLNEQTILQPKENLECGIDIMSKQLAQTGRLFPAKSFYWSVLSVYTTKRKFIDFFTARVLDILPFCY